MANLLTLPTRVTINEVSPRDGLQNLNRFVPTELKIQLIETLIDAGCPEIELTSFVNPKRVQQMRDAAEIIERTSDRNEVVFSAIVPNVKGTEIALTTPIKKLAFFFSISRHHNKQNVNKNPSESLAELGIIADMCKSADVSLKANIATAFGYEVEGYFPKERVAELCNQVLDFGIDHIVLCDTTGFSNPVHTYQVVAEVKKLRISKLGIHLHKCNGREYANALVALMLGIDYFDLAVGGLGGCPFTPEASGNTATEFFVEMLDQMGIETGIDLEKIIKSAQLAKQIQQEYVEEGNPN